jgi:DNA invertase Pin-like site-specific DNA recombinase
MNRNYSKIYHAAIYVRLSKEDGDAKTSAKAESNSISNQKSLVREFLEDKEDIEVVKEYVDDGYSGSNFERPAFQMMLEDIKKGKIDCVCTKDLSRFGREYIDSGMYIERVFPAMGVRFIAVNDNYDSADGREQSDEIIVPFKNLINDAYCRDISIKIRSHLEIKRKNGEYIGSFTPFGYMKSKEDYHKIVPDSYAANVVQDIFKMKLHGMSQDGIAKRLNETGVLPPAEYKASIGSNYQTGFKSKEKSEWTSVMVRRILTNEVYIGNLVQGRQTTPNHKIKKTVLKEESDWIRIEKNHEAVIGDREFEVVQRLLSMDTRTAPEQEGVYPLSGLVCCGECGMPMVRKTSTVGGKTYAYYMCSTYKSTKECSPHRIATGRLEDAVLVLLQQHIANVMELKRILSFIGTVPFQQIDMKKLEERKLKKEAEMERCTQLRTTLYEDMKEGMISKEDYKELHAAYYQQ